MKISNISRLLKYQCTRLYRDIEFPWRSSAVDLPQRDIILSYANRRERGDNENLFRRFRVPCRACERCSLYLAAHTNTAHAWTPAPLHVIHIYLRDVDIYAFMCIRYLSMRACTLARFSVPIHRISTTLTYRGFLSFSIPHTVRKSWATETNSPLTIAEIRPWNRHWCERDSPFKFSRAYLIRQVYSNFPINFYEHRRKCIFFDRLLRITCLFIFSVGKDS